KDRAARAASAPRAPRALAVPTAPLGSLRRVLLELLERRRRVRQRPRGRGAEAVEGQREVAAPEVGGDLARRLDDLAELPEQDVDVGRREVGAERSPRPR